MTHAVPWHTGVGDIGGTRSTFTHTGCYGISDTKNQRLGSHCPLAVSISSRFLSPTCSRWWTRAFPKAFPSTTRWRYLRNDADVKEFLQDVSSFANTFGGHRLSVWTRRAALPPRSFRSQRLIPIMSCSACKRDAPALTPCLRLANKADAIPAGGFVVITRVPRSWNPPHRVLREPSAAADAAGARRRRGDPRWAATGGDAAGGLLEGFPVEWEGQRVARFQLAHPASVDGAQPFRPIHRQPRFRSRPCASIVSTRYNRCCGGLRDLPGLRPLDPSAAASGPHRCRRLNIVRAAPSPRATVRAFRSARLRPV